MIDVKSLMVQVKQVADTRVMMLGILCITVLELYALSQGMNGTLFALVVGLIAASIGVVLPQPKFLKRK